MYKLIIESDNGNKHSYYLLNYTVTDIDNHSLKLALLLASNQSIVYKICIDERNKSIEKMSNLLVTTIEQNLSTHKKIFIREYLDRCYIFIKDDLHYELQFTAHKIVNTTN